MSNCIIWDNRSTWGVVVGPDPTYSCIEGGHLGLGNIDVDPCFAVPGFWDPNGTPDDANNDFWVDGDCHLKSEAGRWQPSIYTNVDLVGDGFINLVHFAVLAEHWGRKGGFLPGDLDYTGSVDFNDLALLLNNYMDEYSPGTWVYDSVNSLCIDAGDPNSDWTKELWPHGKCINMGAYGGTPEASMSPSTVGNIADLNTDDVVSFGDFTQLGRSFGFDEVLLAEDFDRNGIVHFNDVWISVDNWLWEQ